MVIPLDDNATDFLGIRHGWTLLDLYVQKYEHEKYVVVPEEKTLKGWSDEVHRESDVAVLAAEATAYAILEAYEEPLRTGRRKLISVASESGRTSEHQQIIWYVLSKEIGNFEHRTSFEFRERFFANIQGLKLAEIEKKVLEIPDDSGKLYPNIRQALTYSTNFKWLERAFNVEEQGGEEFPGYTKRTYDGVRELVESLHREKERYICLMVFHQISGIPTLGSFKLLNRHPADVYDQIKYAKSLDEKEAVFSYCHIDPARLQRVRLCSCGGRYFYELHESNGEEHLKLLMENIKSYIRDRGRLAGEKGDRANQIRDLIEPWYVKKGWPVSPYENPGGPISLKDSDDAPKEKWIKVSTPIELSSMLSEKGKLPDSYVRYYFGNYDHVDDILNWMEHSFGYKELAQKIGSFNAQLTDSGANVGHIRDVVSKAIEGYAAQQ